MKTIVDKKTAVSIYLFDDDTFVHMGNENIRVGDPVNFYIGDLHNHNAFLHEDIKDAPKDWVGHKYTYDGTTWKANSDWVDPSKSS